MSKQSIGRVLGFVGAVGASAALVGVAANGTGAYFSDTKPGGSVATTIGTISLADGSDNTVTLDRILPGERKSDTISYTNDGTREQDVWIVFDSTAPAFAVVNNLGRYGFAEIKGAGNVQKFASENLNDNRGGTCNDASVCKPIPVQVKVAENLASNATETASIMFGIHAASATQPTLATSSFSLPFTVVATQPGILPGATASVE